VSPVSDLRGLYNIEGDGPNRWILQHRPVLPPVTHHWETPADIAWRASESEALRGVPAQRVDEAIDLVHRMELAGGCS
jgi:hypothetical protein